MDRREDSTSGTDVVFYDIAFRQPAQQFSCAPNPWKARYALNFKKIRYTTRFVDMLEITHLRKDVLQVPASRRYASGDDFYTLPVLTDKSTDAKLGDSFDIAVYLHKTYPNSGDGGNLFPEQKLDFTCAYELAKFVPLSDREDADEGIYREYAQFNTNVDSAFTNHVPLWGSNMCFDESREEAIRARFCERAGIPWEAMAVRGEARARMLESMHETMGRLAQAVFRRPATDGPFILGSQLSYADLIVGGWLRMQSVCLPPDEWEQVRSRHDGTFARLHDALQQYSTV
eukprot:TRINITY_DN2313_c0_g1_i2.p1 TRINITY_DN2313_c0_g1~~TRINITY_DN2313_c0_g1_i2.p1  ORF type:complete len:287 (+),score=50.59 TRINITY_DN2313_c0_g1_i2:60-920(+)